MLNKVELAGTMVKDPDVRDLKYRGEPTGIRADFTLAVKGVRWDRDSGVDVIESVFIACQAWETAAAAAALLHKGCVVQVTGQLTQQEVEGAGGKKERKTRVRVLTLIPVRVPTAVPAAGVVPDEGGEF